MQRNGICNTHFHYDLTGNLIAETDATGKAIREYIYLNNQPVLLLQNNQIYDYQNDHLGTPQKLTDSTNKTVWEATYTPLGEAKVTTSTIKNPLRYPGQYFDEESGFHYNWHRYYDPKTGQYLESDPLGSAVSPFIYGYAENDWVNKLDPMGLDAIADWERADAMGDMLRNYIEMKQVNFKKSDKYFHCKANCEASSRGEAGMQGALFASNLREWSDNTFPKKRNGGVPDSPKDCQDDWKANWDGIKGSKSGKTCEKVCNQYRPPGLPDRY